MRISPSAAGPGWYQGWVAGWVRAQERRGKAAASVTTWGVYLRDLGAFLNEEGIVDPELLTRGVLQRWQDRLSVRLQPASCQVAAAAGRSLLKWSDREEVSARSGLWSWLDTPHVPEREPRALEPAELTAILTAYAAPSRNLEHMRDRALFWFLTTTGARISEALQVDVADVHGGRMVVRQKGGNQHRLVMSERARIWVLEYLRCRGRDQEDALWVHIGARGRHRLRAGQVNTTWAALAVDLGIPPFTSHALRHTGVTELGARDDVSDDDIVKHVGWRSAAMMPRYRLLRDGRHQQVVDRLDDLVPAPAPPPATRRRRRRYRVIEGTA